MKRDIKEKAIRELLAKSIKTQADLMRRKREIAKKHKIGMLKNSDILKNASAEPLVKILRKRKVRTLSGIAPVAVLTKPFSCPAKCAYCPTMDNVPKSYLPNEPAVMRAIRCEYNPYKQVRMRLKALEANGHNPTKIEIIVIGGTWSALPQDYKYWYIANCFAAANNFQTQNSKLKTQKLSPKLKIEELKRRLLIEQKKNESARYKIIGLTLETRPDYINENELLEMRELGCTRVELGVQAIDDKILEKNTRGHGVKEIANATKLLKDYGFKVTYHIMPALPGSTPKRDLEMFKQLFTDERFQPDQIKFYPTVVIESSKLYEWWKEGKYKPYSDKILENLIIECKREVPKHVRIIRLVRDIPSESIVAGNKITNLRQVMQAKGVKCNCIRCREVKDRQLQKENYGLKIKKYKASGGKEYFIEATDEKGKILYGFCRLRLPTVETQNFASLQNTALIRELHVYGELVPVGGKKIVQHAGLGTRLMKEAEKIAHENGFKKIAVISGVGARGYYRKLGYKLKGTYMVKNSLR